MKSRSSHPNGVESGLNMSQSFPNIKFNHQKHIWNSISDIRITFKKAPQPPSLKK
eukprot:UN22863